MYGLETMAVTEKQQVAQVCENNWMSRIVGVKRADKRRLDGLRLKERFKKTLVRKRPDMWKDGGKWQREQMPRKWKKTGGEEDRECNGRTALREIWEDWEENGEQQQKMDGVGDC